MKEKIIEQIKGKNEISLQDIYDLFPNETKPKVRSNLNWLVNDKQITRLRRGVYGHI